MKNISNFLQEGLKIGKNYKYKKNYNYFPDDESELRAIIIKLLDKRGKDANLNDINTSKITTFDSIFHELDPHNIDISQWDTSNVTEMSYMFYNCKNFNCDLSNWNVSNIEDMSYAFYRCEKFDATCLENWDTSSVNNMEYMFASIPNFNMDFSKWKTDNVENMNFAFAYDKNFEGKGIENWSVRKVKGMSGLFKNCTKFDADFSKWSTNNLIYAQGMFDECINFKGKGLENFDMSNVVNTYKMFYNCKNFNCDLSKWNIKLNKTLSLMFYNCQKFDTSSTENWKINRNASLVGTFQLCKTYPNWWEKYAFS